MKTETSRRSPFPVVLMTLLLVPGPVWAPTIVVDESTCTLIDAVIAANTDAPSGGCPAGSGADTISLATDVLLAAPYAGGFGLPKVTSEIMIEGNAFAIERDPSAPPFDLIDSSATLGMNEVALRNGGVRADWFLTLSNSTISNAPDCAIEVYYTTVNLDGCAVTDSYRGICGRGHNLTDTIVTGNVIGMDVDSNSITFLTNSAVTDNLSAGIEGWNDDHLELTDSTVSGNGGPGIDLGPQADVYLTNSTVSGNAGAGIVTSYASTLFVARSTVSGNGYHGVALLAENTGVLSNSTISGNSGAGVFINTSPIHGAPLIRRSTIWGNSGAGIELSNSAELSVRGTIVGANSGGDCDLSAGTSLYDQGANLGEDGSCGAGFATISGVDPVLADNGGPTRTHALLAGSTAIDAGGVCDYDTDQRGLPRSDNACDGGAFEFQCPITVIDLAGETQIFFSPASSGFDLVTGMLSRLHSEGGFAAASCLGSFPASPAVDGLPDPPPGDGRYYLARGQSDCVGAGYGDSSVIPDPRDDLVPGPCP